MKKKMFEVYQFEFGTLPYRIKFDKKHLVKRFDDKMQAHNFKEKLEKQDIHLEYKFILLEAWREV